MEIVGFTASQTLVEGLTPGKLGLVFSSII